MGKYEEEIDTVTFREVIELFITTTIFDMQKEREVPKVNFIFKSDGLELINDLKNNPFKKDGYFTPNIDEKDYELFLSQNQIKDNEYNIVVHDANMFFRLLTDIINEQVKLEYEYYGFNNARYKALLIMKRIWLRMSTEDFDSVENFLQKQLDFIKDRTLDDKRRKSYLHDKINEFNGLDVYCSVHPQETYYETSRVINFYVKNESVKHDLANVLFDIREEDGKRVCYIYALQMPKLSTRNKELERKLYKVNSLSSDGTSSVHPNFSISLLLFIDILRSHNIDHIKVPLYQVLSYDYHRILSRNTKEKFESTWNEKKFKELEYLKNSKYKYDNHEYEEAIKEYEYDKEWYKHVVDREDDISRAKTDNLVKLFTFIESISALHIDALPLDDTLYLDISLSEENKLRI